MIPPDKVRDAIRLMNRERRLRRGLAELMKADVPPLTGRQLLDCKSIISGIDSDLEHYQRLLDELRAKLDPETDFYSMRPSAGGESAGPARVLLTGVPVVHGAERVMDLIEDHGGLVVCQENCTGLKPILEDVPEDSPDLLRALAEKYYHLPCSVRTPNRQRIELLRRLAAEYRVDCVIELIWQACLTYAVESFQVRRLAEQELGMPYLRIETDYSPTDSARIAVRIEALVEMVRSRRNA
jgi:benzoyl-CoA reductase/2-hydroxyglutaryl-CoA dehydratase subunit BcrC/BadD/HgdB